VVAKGVSPPAWTSITEFLLPLQEHKARQNLTAPHVFLPASVNHPSPSLAAPVEKSFAILEITATEGDLLHH
jgi:hypothetical protein